MGNEKKILELLQQQPVVSFDTLKSELGFSERKVREELKLLRDDAERYGFEIKTIANEGYCLKINDQFLFEDFLSMIKDDFSYAVQKKEFRVLLIIFLILQNEDYISLNRIAELIDVSRNTVINDLDDIKLMLSEYDLQLESKPKHGVRVIGLEKDIRKMLSKISGSIVEHQSLNAEFFEFVSLLDFTEESEVFEGLLNEYNIIMSNNAVESILFHIKIMLFRLMQGNNINEITINHQLIDERIYELSSKIVKYLEDKHHLDISHDEMGMLASQIFGKASVMQITEEQKNEMNDDLESVLRKIDQDFATNFAEDKLLIENLMLHVHPLVARVAYGLELADSLVGSVSAQYMNSFLVAMKFIEYQESLKDYELSRDEIGYIALHFATSLERLNQERLQKVKSVVLVADQMRSSIRLLKVKLQGIFPLANILLIPYTSLPKYSLDDAELVISTIDLDFKDKENKLVLIGENLNENDIRRIRNKILMNEDDSSSTVSSIRDLFYEELTFVEKEETDYMALLRKIAKRMENLGYAKEGYVESVIEREERFSTIYQNGVCGPHSLVQMANVDSIGVALLKNPITYNNKEVNIIFLINIKKGHIRIHQEIGEFIVKLMEDRNTVKQLKEVRKYEEFLKIVDEYI